VLQHRVRLFHSVELELDDVVLEGVLAGVRDVGDAAARVGREHDPVLDEVVLRDDAEDVAAGDEVAHLELRVFTDRGD
jgi:hypothetical protein